ncbi:MAG TPA: hypothetical protein DCM05_16010 [Elusimicrobia bacterium]|nr:hypothetical protein [Elusimicrobiota bacterium]
MRKGWALCAAAVAALAALGPVRDPDLWWHLSAGRFLRETLAIPRADWLSHTMAGAPWVDFEWLAQAVFYGAWQAGGLAGLWGLKTLLFAAAAWAFWRLLGEELPVESRAAGLAAWAACMIPRADLRVELFSNIAFLVLLLGVRRLRGAGRGLLFGTAALFALWANLHAGFAAGLLLLLLHAAGEALDRRGGRALLLLSAALAGLAGTLLNPYGLGLYSLLVSHAAEGAAIARLIQEWGPMRPGRLVHWPAFLLMAAAAAAFIRGREKASTGAWLAAGVFGLAALLHARFIPYFAALAVPLVVPILRPRLCAGLIASCAALALWAAPPGRLFDDVYRPSRAAAFLEKHPDMLAKRLYNEWGWGGWLGFRFGPELKVFQDGRYLFHPLFVEAAEAARTPEGWGGFLDRYGIETAVVENSPLMRTMTRLYPDGSQREFRRPFFIEYFPRKDWALLHFDAKALVFARRSAFPPESIAPLEYRLLRPRDEEALADALERGEVDRKALEAERRRFAAD